MELFFNELSVYDMNLENDGLHNLLQVARESYKIGISTCRISPEDSGRIFNAVHQCCGREGINVFLSFFKPPYESESVENIQDNYLAHDWKCEGKSCYGLALSYLEDSAAVSYDGLEKWRNYKVEITCDGNLLEAKNISNENSFTRFRDYFENLKQVEIVESLLNPGEKKIDIRNDHGKDKLVEFAKKIVRSPYVVEVINSEDYSRYSRRFIKKVYPDGKIHIVLPWTDEGLGIKIQTTGRNLKETEEIAKILEKEYGGRR